MVMFKTVIKLTQHSVLVEIEYCRLKIVWQYSASTHTKYIDIYIVFNETT